MVDQQADKIIDDHEVKQWKCTTQFQKYLENLPIWSIPLFSKILKSLTVSQAAACDGIRITTTAVGQDVAPGTLPTY